MSHFNVSISKFAPSAEWLQTQSRRLVAAWKLEVLFTAVSQNAHAHASEPSAVVEGYIEADICHPSFLVHSVLLLPMCCCAVPCLSVVCLSRHVPFLLLNQQCFIQFTSALFDIKSTYNLFKKKCRPVLPRLHMYSHEQYQREHWICCEEEITRDVCIRTRHFNVQQVALPLLF